MSAPKHEGSRFKSANVVEASDLCLTRDEVLARINNEVRELYVKSSTDLSKDEIVDCASTFIASRRSSNRKKLLSRLLIYSLVVAGLCGALYFDASYNWVAAHARLVTISLVKPYYDFTKHYNDQCLIANPLFEEPIEELNCDVCRELGGAIETMPASDAQPSVLMSEFLEAQVPVVITGALESWPAYRNQLTVQDLYKMYKNSPALADNFKPEHSCTVIGAALDFRDVLSTLSKSDTVKSYSGAWQHCHLPAYKEFRKLYRRLDFVPPAAEATQSNIVLTAFGTKKKTGMLEDQSLTILQDGNDLALWIGQVTGKLHYTLSAVSDCHDKCPTYQLQLQAGDFLLVPLDLWEISFRPVSANAPEAVAIGSGLVWDRM